MHEHLLACSRLLCIVSYILWCIYVDMEPCLLSTRYSTDWLDCRSAWITPIWTEHISTHHKHYDDICWSIYGAVWTRLPLHRSCHTLADSWPKSELSRIALVAVRWTALCCLYYCVQYALIVALFRWLDCQERASHLGPRDHVTKGPGVRDQGPKGQLVSVACIYAHRLR